MAALGSIAPAGDGTGPGERAPRQPPWRRAGTPRGIYAPAWKRRRFGGPHPQTPAGSAPRGVPRGAASRAHPGPRGARPRPAAGTGSAPARCHRPPMPAVPSPGVTLARRRVRTYLSSRSTVDMSACSRVQASSHWVRPSTMAWHSTHRKRRVFSARCSTLPRSAGGEERGARGFAPAQHPPDIPLPWPAGSCCPPTRSFLLLLLLAFGLSRRLQRLLPSSAVPCKAGSRSGPLHGTGRDIISDLFLQLSCSSSVPPSFPPNLKNKGAAQLAPNPILDIRESTRTLWEP